MDILSAPVSNLCWKPVTCLTAPPSLPEFTIRALHFAPSCSVNKGSLFLDARPGPFTLGTPPSPCCRGRAGAEPWGQQEQRGLGHLVAWQRGELGSHLGFAVGPWVPPFTSLCLSCPSCKSRCCSGIAGAPGNQGTVPGA